MALPIFKSWKLASWHIASWNPRWKVIFNNTTGSPIGIQSQNANGFDGIWAPTPITPAEFAAPDPLMLADLNATFQLNVAPYNRYRSDGTQFVPLDGESGTVIPPGIIDVFASPLVIYANSPLIIEGGVKVLAFV